MDFQHYDDISSKQFDPYRKLRKSELSITLGERYFVAETHRVVSLLLDSSLEMHSVLLTEQWLGRLDQQKLLNKLSLDQIYVTTVKNMESIVGFNLHQGIMAIAKRPEETSLDQMSKRIMVLNGVVNPENVGSVVRTGVSFGFYSYLLDQYSAHLYHRRAVRVSMGNVFETQFLQVKDLNQKIFTLKERGYRILGADSRVSTQKLEGYRFPSQYALILGSEFKGMNPELFEYCDDIIEISTKYPINASHAASIFMYEANR